LARRPVEQTERLALGGFGSADVSVARRVEAAGQAGSGLRTAFDPYAARPIFAGSEPPIPNRGRGFPGGGGWPVGCQEGLGATTDPDGASNTTRNWIGPAWPRVRCHTDVHGCSAPWAARKRRAATVGGVVRSPSPIDRFAPGTPRPAVTLDTAEPCAFRPTVLVSFRQTARSTASPGWEPVPFARHELAAGPPRPSALCRVSSSTVTGRDPE